MSALANPGKPRIQTAARTIDILQAVAATGGGGISAKDLAANLGLPRQVVYHLLHTLVLVNMLRRAGGGGYVLGLGVASLAQGFRRQLSSSDYLGRYAELAAATTGETAYTIGWVDGEIVVLAAARGSETIRAGEIEPGMAGDAHARASGKLLLAMSSEHETDRYLARHPLSQRTSNTLVTREALEEEFVAIRRTKISVEQEEYLPGLSCMAVPIGPEPTQLALGISAPMDRFRVRRYEYASALTRIARDARF